MNRSTLVTFAPPSPTLPLDGAIERQRINLEWLIRLRWAAIAGQLITVLLVHLVLAIPLPIAPLLSIIACEAVSNLIGQSALRIQPEAPLHEGWCVALMAIDVLALTGLLFFAGGPFNPFSFLYLVQIAQAAVVLRGTTTWAIVGLSLLCSAFLFLEHRPLDLSGLEHSQHMDIHLEGMWVALVVAAGFIVYFLLRVTRALAEREQELRAARALATRRDRLASLATMAAGAAHELSTPLSTIALAVGELARSLPPDALTGAAKADLQLIRGQVDRSRAILDRIARDAGTDAGEPIVATPLHALVDEATSELPDTVAIRVRYGPAAAAAVVTVPRRALARALRGVLKNAQEASEPGQEVSLEVVVDDGGTRFTVVDQGVGMTREVARRVGEPFYTTKPPGHGMGLGLFLTQAVVQQLGGDVSIESEPDQGTRIALRLPPPTGGARGSAKPMPGADPAGAG